MKQQIFIMFFSLVLCMQQAFGMWNYWFGSQQHAMQIIQKNKSQEITQNSEKNEFDNLFFPERQINNKEQRSYSFYLNGPALEQFPFTWHPKEDAVVALVNVENDYNPKKKPSIALWDVNNRQNQDIEIADVSPLDYQIIDFNGDGSLMAFKKNTEKEPWRPGFGFSNTVGLYHLMKKKCIYFDVNDATAIALSKFENKNNFISVTELSSITHEANTDIYSIDPETLQTKKILSKPKMWNVSWNPQKNWIAATNSSLQTAIIDLEDGKEKLVLKPGVAINNAYWLTGDLLLVESSFDAMKLFLYATDGKCLATIDCNDYLIYGGPYNEKSTVFPIITPKKLLLYNVAQRKIQTEIINGDDWVRNISIHPDGKSMVAMSRYRWLKSYDLNGKEMKKIDTTGVNSARMKQNCWSKDGKYFAAMVARSINIYRSGDALNIYKKEQLIAN